MFFGIALDHDDTLAVARVAARCRAEHEDGKWVPPANYHVTLQYIGEVDEATVGSLVKMLDSMQEAAETFDWFCDRIDTFMGRRGTVLWFGSMEPQPAFDRMREALLEKLDSGQAEDVFTPHITLGRKTAPRSELLVMPLRMRMDNVTLFESTRTDGNLVYRPIASRKLKPPSNG